VPSRVAAKFDVEVFDHNKLETAKSLGAGLINLADLEPFEAVEKKISLVSSKDGAKGWVRVVRLSHPGSRSAFRFPAGAILTRLSVLTPFLPTASQLPAGYHRPVPEEYVDFLDRWPGNDADRPCADRHRRRCRQGRV
jgi:hypothetical protein